MIVSVRFRISTNYSQHVRSMSASRQASEIQLETLLEQTCSQTMQQRDVMQGMSGQM